MTNTLSVSALTKNMVCNCIKIESRFTDLTTRKSLPVYRPRFRLSLNTYHAESTNLASFRDVRDQSGAIFFDTSEIDPFAVTQKHWIQFAFFPADALEIFICMAYQIPVK